MLVLVLVLVLVRSGRLGGSSRWSRQGRQVDRSKEHAGSVEKGLAFYIFYFNGVTAAVGPAVRNRIVQGGVGVRKKKIELHRGRGLMLVSGPIQYGRKVVLTASGTSKTFLYGWWDGGLDGKREERVARR